jgi:hypothetical protein
MRATEEQRDFANWLLLHGNGITPTMQGLELDDIEVPSSSCIEHSLVNSIFSEASKEERRSRVILSLKNSDYISLNEENLELLPGKSPNVF